MAEDNQTKLEDKCSILADLWLSLREDEAWAEFIEFSDIGLPLAYMIDNDIIPLSTITDTAEGFIHETFELLLRAVDIEKDTGFEMLEDIIG
jgi:hypothetical protein